MDSISENIKEPGRFEAIGRDIGYVMDHRVAVYCADASDAAARLVTHVQIQSVCRLEGLQKSVANCLINLTWFVAYMMNRQ